MTIRVDAAAGVVASGDVHWPLRLDCLTGTAVLSIGDQELAVAPLRWRDKQRLARWAHLGPTFVAEHSAELAVPPGTVLDDHTRALVAAVAEFLNGDTLPLSPDLLAEVAVDVCRLTGLAPAAFDDRDAIDVEAAWRYAKPDRPAQSDQSGQSAHRPSADHAADDDSWADATRIVITPDPPPADEPSTASPALRDTSDAPDSADLPEADAERAHVLSLVRPAPERARTPDADPEGPAPRAIPPAHPRAGAERRRAGVPYRIAPVSVPTPVPTRAPERRTTDVSPEPGGSSDVPPLDIGGPLVAPAAAPPIHLGGNAAASQAGALTLPAAAVDATDPDTLEALTAAVTDRLSEQLTKAGHDLGIEV